MHKVAFRQIGSLARRLLLMRGQQITGITKPEEVHDFLGLLRPITTGLQLVRVGGEGDGGYLIPDDLDNIEACFSPGVSDIATFESGLASRGIKCFLADHAVDAPPVHHPLFHFEKKYLGLADDAVHMTLETWLKTSGPFASDLLLQMDIEGGEYDVIFDSSNDTLRRFRILVIEFHFLDVLITHPMAFKWLKATFTKLLKSFDVVHMHPNNCLKPRTVSGYSIPPIMEFTFLRKDRVTVAVPTTCFPHRLDRPNVPGNPDYPLPNCWFEAPRPTQFTAV